MQISAFLLDYEFSLEKAFALPRLDVNESDTITVDPEIDISIIEELKKYFQIEFAQNLVFPKLYSCPSGVYRNSKGLYFFV